MKATLGIQHQQHLSLSPKLQQAIRLLQLSTIDLQNEIQETLNNNFLLEGVIPSPIQDNTVHENNTNDDAADNEFDALSPWDFASSESHTWPIYPENMPNLEHYCPQTITLKDYLHWQFDLCPFSDMDRLAGAAIIDSLNEDGLLFENALTIYQAVFKNNAYSFEAFEAVRHYIQCLDPIGCAAETPTESVLIQLQQQSPQMPLQCIAKDILKHDAATLASGQYGALQKKYRISVAMIQKMLVLIQTTTTMSPGRLFNENIPELTIPDLILAKTRGKWQVQWNPEVIPKISLNTYYLSLIPQTKDKSEKQFLKTHLQEAQWFIKNIQNRHEMILKVAQHIVEFHHNFFENNDTLKPLILSDVAQSLGINASTVSRVVNHKYIFTPKGLFELKYFFSNAVGKNQDPYSAMGIQHKIKRLIHNESHTQPLTDQKIVRLLYEEGITLARRTVTKYREHMGFPPSHGRRLKK